MCCTSEAIITSELREGRFASCRPESFNNEHPDKKTSIKSLRMLYKAVKYLRKMDRVKINVMFALSSSCLKGFNGNVDVGSLDDYLQHRGPATPSLTKVFTKQILMGLEYLHDREITHGNLTCKNTLLGHQLNLRLSNFDVVNTTAVLYKCLPLCPKETVQRPNTSCFPDNLVNKHRFDLWCVGCAVTQMLSGALTCTGTTKDQHFNTLPDDYAQLVTWTPGLKQFLDLIFQGQQGVLVSAGDLLQQSFITDTT